MHDVLRSRHSGFQGLQGCIQTNEFNIGKGTPFKFSTHLTIVPHFEFASIGSILVEFDSHATAQLAQQILGDRRMNVRPHHHIICETSCFDNNMDAFLGSTAACWLAIKGGFEQNRSEKAAKESSERLYSVALK